ncbi:MAG: Hsp70 family protein [Candidatus Nanopelagicales bacterium]
MGYSLGIDLGTTFTAAAYIEDGEPRMLDLGNRNVTIPSVLFVASDGQLLFGETAERRSSSEPDRVLREFKRRIGDPVPMVAGHQSFDPITLQSDLLRWVLQVARERLGAAPDHVVVTYPANWGLFKIRLMRDITAAAGISGAWLCPEPVAAAIEYAAQHDVPVGAKVAIYDLGGGTFDVAVLEKADDGFESIGTPLGVEHLGGSDFDEAVLADTVSKFGLRGLDPDDPAVARGLAALRRECIEAKESLSSDIATDITSLLPGAGSPVRLTRREFEGLIHTGLEESIRTTVRALRLAGVDNSDLHVVVLVGGSSRIPLVAELLTRELGVPVAADTFPEQDIALGAARYAVLQSPNRVDSVTGTTTTMWPGRIDPTESADPVLSAPVEQVSPASSTVRPETPAPTPPHFASDAGRSQRPPEILAKGAARRPGEPTPTSRERSKRTIPILLAMVIVVICLAVAGIVAFRGRSATPVAPPLLTPPLATLPVGPPLSTTQLVVPRYTQSGAPSQLWLIDSLDPLAATNLEAIHDGSAFGIGMSPDRRTITYIDSGADAIRAMPAAGGTGQRLFDSPEGCGKIHHASWSPTDLAVFALECQLGSGPRRIAVVDLDGPDGTIARELDTGPLQPSDPTISPDGATVAFWTMEPEPGVDGGSIFVMPLDGSGAPTLVTDGGLGTDSDPAWSPDGMSLAFRRTVGDPSAGDSDIMVVAAAGGTPRKATSGPAADEKPSWSPEGDAIAFVSDRDADGSTIDHENVWRVPTEGGRPTPIGQDSYRYATPTWWHR